MDWVTRLDKQMEDYLPDVRVLREEPMARHTSFRVGGPARRMAFPEKGEQLVLLLSMAWECGARPLVIGNGTNLLAPDSGLDRLVVETSGLSRLDMGEEPGSLLAESGVPLARLADFACRQGLTGLEFAHGIPGTVGGGVCMNAGAYGGDSRYMVYKLVRIFLNDAINALPIMLIDPHCKGYRNSIFLQIKHRLTHILLFFHLKRYLPCLALTDSLNLCKTLRLLLNNTESIFLKLLYNPACKRCPYTFYGSGTQIPLNGNQILRFTYPCRLNLKLCPVKPVGRIFSS